MFCWLTLTEFLVPFTTRVLGFSRLKSQPIRVSRTRQKDGVGVNVDEGTQPIRGSNNVLPKSLEYGVSVYRLWVFSLSKKPTVKYLSFL